MTREVKAEKQSTEKYRQGRHRWGKEMERKRQAEGRERGTVDLGHVLHIGWVLLCSVCFCSIYNMASDSWSLMNDSICKLHFICQKSLRMSGSGRRGRCQSHDVICTEEKKGGVGEMPFENSLISVLSHYQ